MKPGSVLSASALRIWLRGRIDARDPTAVVRFGDGEAKLLKAHAGDAASMGPAVRTLEGQTGIAMGASAVIEIRSLVLRAWEGADVIGVFLGNQCMRNRLVALRAERLASTGSSPLVARSMLHHDIVDELPSLLTGHPVSVVSCRDLKPVLEADWGLEDVAAYQVPSQHAVRDVDGPYEQQLHHLPIWPNGHAEVRTRLQVREPGEVFLVGAGLFGKDLCIQIRDQGGIAIDMGSALDRIAGKLTRGPKRRVLELHAAGKSPTEIAERMEAIFDVPVDPATVSEFLVSTDGLPDKP